MTITKLSVMGGEAEVLGQVRKFFWDEATGQLMLAVPRLDDMHTILAHLSVGLMVGVAVPVAAKTNEKETSASHKHPVDAVQNAPVATAVVNGSVGSAAVPPVASVEHQLALGILAMPAVATGESFSEQVMAAKLDTPPVTVSVPPPAPPAGSMAAEHAQAPGNADPVGNPDPWGLGVPKLPAEVTGARRLRTVLEFIEQQQPGIDKAGVLLAMEKLKADIPLIARIVDLPTRVEALFS